MHVLVTRLTKKATNTREKPPNALRLTFSTAGQPHDAAGRRRRPKYDLAKNGQPAPSEASATHPDDVRPPLRVVGAPAATASREDNLGSIQTVASIASPSPRAELNLYQREKASQPASLRLGAAARSDRAPDTGDLRGPRHRACRLGRHPSQDASVGDGCVRC